MIWDYIRDFLVQYIFGGHLSDNTFVSGYVGYNVSTDVPYYTDDIYHVMSFKDDFGESLQLSLGDWLSTTATIIIMALAVVLACLLVRWIWRVVSSAMLLK